MFPLKSQSYLCIDTNTKDWISCHVYQHSDTKYASRDTCYWHLPPFHFIWHLFLLIILHKMTWLFLRFAFGKVYLGCMFRGGGQGFPLFCYQGWVIFLCVLSTPKDFPNTVSSGNNHDSLKVTMSRKACFWHCKHELIFYQLMCSCVI